MDEHNHHHHHRLQELGLVIPSLHVPEANVLNAGADGGAQQHAASLASMTPASEEAKQKLKALKAAEGEK